MPIDYSNLPDQNASEGYSPYPVEAIRFMLSRYLLNVTAEPSKDDLKWALNALNARLPLYAEYQAYYDGDHPLLFATEKFRNAFGNTFKRLVDNLCPKVVDVLADRLRVTGFSCELDQSIDTEDSQADVETESKYGDLAWDIWKRNRMPRWAGVQATASLTLGDAYGLVWPDIKNSRKARIYIHRGDQMIVKYDAEDPNIIQFGMKWWTLDNGLVRVNMYYPKFIDRWYTPTKPTLTGLPLDPALFEPYEDDPDNLGSRIPNPYNRVPIFPFPNAVGPGQLGRSELKAAIPIQNALNKTLADMMVAMEFVAVPQRYAVGVDTEPDADGKDPLETFEAAVNRLWATANPDAKFGEFPAADLNFFIEAAEKWRVEMARVTSTPIHHINQSTNDAPSGESLKTAEAPLTAKQDDRTEAFGESYAEMMAFAVFIETNEKVEYEVQWKDTVPRNSKEYLEGLQIKKDLGVTKRFILQEAGYSSAEIDKMEDEAEVTAPQVGDALLAAFDGGQPSRPIAGGTTPAVGIQPVAPIGNQAVASSAGPMMNNQG